MKHAVYFYEDDTFLIESVADFAKEGLERQETVIIVATEQHRSDVKTKLSEDLVGLWAPASRNYVTLDASTTLGLFMRNGWPDEGLFLKVIGHMIQSAGGGKPVRIYGEMVAVLWAEGNTLAAIHLERLWNKLASQQDFRLLCGYSTSAFQGPAMGFAFEDICSCHSEIKGVRASA